MIVPFGEAETRDAGESTEFAELDNKFQVGAGLDRPIQQPSPCGPRPDRRVRRWFPNITAGCRL